MKYYKKKINNKNNKKIIIDFFFIIYHNLFIFNALNYLLVHYKQTKKKTLSDYLK